MIEELANACKKLCIAVIVLGVSCTILAILAAVTAWENKKFHDDYIALCQKDN